MSKLDEIIKTKSESGAAEFERLRTQQEKRSARAARTATLSRRTEGAPPDHTRRLVRVTAVERKGHDGFYRAGQFWPSGDGRIALVTGRMFEALKSEPNLRVELDPELEEADRPTDEDVLDVPVRESIDLSQTLLTPAPGMGQGADALRAAFEAGRMSVEIERLRAENAHLKAAQGGAPPAPPKPPVDAPPAPAGGDGGDDPKKGASKK
jgi:hypothetical protein